MKGTKWMLVAVVAIAVAAMSVSVHAQANTATATLTVAAVKAETLTVSATPFTAFDVSTGASTSQTSTITTNWNLRPTRTSVQVCAYMNTSQTALKGTDVSNTDSIPFSAVQAQGISGSFASINGGAGCGQPNVTVISNNTLTTRAQRMGGSKSDTLPVKLVGVLTTIQPDTYSADITVVAYAAP